MLYLVRHGQDVDNSRNLINGRRDTPLTELGRAQAMAVADSLRLKQIRCVYTSPLQRARETASIILHELGLVSELIIDAALIERDYGILTGRPPSDIPVIARGIVLSHGFRYVVDSEGIEPYLELWTRAGDVLRKIQARHPTEEVLVVAHNEIIKMIRANYEKRSWEEEILMPPMVHCEVIALGP